MACFSDLSAELRLSILSYALPLNNLLQAVLGVVKRKTRGDDLGFDVDFAVNSTEYHEYRNRKRNKLWPTKVRDAFLKGTRMCLRSGAAVSY